ncbi:MAG TPA: MutS family DNA mismatch repair protein, partial [Blastocatellia bacterium]|nr:MutS family DNA mismatch repair protein [Blastocatellia bacterium]
PDWIETWVELEALISLADLAELNPDYTFPEVVSAGPADGAIFEARQIGHPLLLRGRRVVNDFRLDHEHRITVLTGSNMSGKSTFLRTLGANLSLAYAGAPVNAERLTISLFSVFTCIKVSDSVADGLSYFYAEVKRLKALLESVVSDKSRHHFVLIDEIFRGTNNRERRIGSWAFIKRLSTTDCLGAVATHDLELVKLADEMPSISNYHFREDVTDGRMVFDYELRSGPSPTTNALKIMELEGLPVDPA